MENLNITALIFVVVVITLVFNLARYLRRRGRMRRSGLPAKAVVTNVSVDTRLKISFNTTEYMTTPRREYLHQLAYSVDGRAYTGSYVSYVARNVGDVIDIFCNPDNPSDMMLAQLGK